MIKQQYITENLVMELSNQRLSQRVVDYIVRNREFLSEYESSRPEEYFTENYWRERLAKDEQSQGVEALGSITFWVRRKDSEDVIGMVSFSNIVWEPFMSCFITYKLDKQWLNRGLASEAVGKAVEIAFTDMGLHRIEANIMPKNKASIRVAEKVGFKNEGIAEQYLKINGRWEDHIHMTIINENI